MNDVAILTLNASITDVTPVQLPVASSSPDLYVGQSSVVIGWGKTDPKIGNTKIAILKCIAFFIMFGVEFQTIRLLTS